MPASIPSYCALYVTLYACIRLGKQALSGDHLMCWSVLCNNQVQVSLLKYSEGNGEAGYESPRFDFPVMYRFGFVLSTLTLHPTILHESNINPVWSRG
jgi:hypothetical protein